MGDQSSVDDVASLATDQGDHQTQDHDISASPAEGTTQPVTESPLELLKKSMVEGEDKPTEAEPTKVEEVKPEQTTQAEIAEELPGKEVVEDAYGDIPETERTKLGKRAQARIHQLHDKYVQATKVVEESKPLIATGKYIAEFAEKTSLDANAIQTILNLGAAVQNAPDKALPVVERIVADLRSKLNIAAPEPVAELKPFDGELPARYQDMIDVMGVAEADVRLLYAAKQKKPAAQPVAPQPVVPVQPAPVAQPQVNTAVVEEQLVNHSIQNFFLAEGVADAAAYAAKLGPILAEIAPGKDPAKIPLNKRLEFVKLAHERVKLMERKATPKKVETPPVQHGTTAARKAAPSTLSPLDALRAKMVK